MISEYSPFNRWKGLLHEAHLSGCARNDFLPPYWVATDPSNQCNNNCIYCNARCFREKTKYATMSGEHLLALASLYRDWGIKATIIEGGGEPLAGERVTEFISQCYLYDIEVGLITNGSLMNEPYWDILPAYARFVGISMDAADEKIYREIRRADTFGVVVRNIEGLCKNKKRLDVRAKMLIQPLNYDKIYAFAKLAKEMGCDAAHIKPVSWEEVEGCESLDLSQYSDVINMQIEKAKELISDDFAVDIITYKHDLQYRKIVNFKHCLCTPIGGVFAADGNFYLCFNMRGRDGFKLCSHFPDANNVRRHWNTKRHKELIANIRPENCMRCGLIQYNEMIEKAIMQDKLFRNFP